MYARVLTACLYGIAGEVTGVEVDVENGLPGFTVVGLANQSIREAKERIHSAILNSGYAFPDKRITVNLTPANKKKEGSHFDLPIAIGVLLASGLLDPKRDLEETAFLGELTLDGRISGAEGVLPMVIGLQKTGVRRVIVPPANAAEAALVKGVDVLAAASLQQAADWLCGFEELDAQAPAGTQEAMPVLADFSDIRGQQAVKRAAQVAAAGSHGMLMIGPPGVGKSMVGKRLAGILPPLSYAEQLEVTQIYSVAGELKEGCPLITYRPFRAPHHGMSSAALAGGGTVPRPGEVSLAHRGVLFLDELPEFSAHTLEVLRQPMEDGEITISRASGRCTYPARFMLVAAMNPCRCGYFGDPVKPCTCSESDRRKYVGRVSGPLLDRIDIHVALERSSYAEVSAENAPPSVSSEDLRKGVEVARLLQEERYRGLRIRSNAELTPLQIGRFCRLDSACETIMEAAFSRYSLSARSYHRVLKVARTIADLAGSAAIGQEHLLEALGYRLPEKYFQ